MDEVGGISQVLGVPPIYALDRGDLVTFRMSNQELGIRLKLELRPSRGWVRLHVDQVHKRGARHIGVIELCGIDGIAIDHQRGEIRIFTDAVELVLSASGTFSIRT